MFFQIKNLVKVLFVVCLAASLAACVSTGKGSNATSGQASNGTNSVAANTQQVSRPEPNLTPRQRIKKAINQLEQGNEQVAEVELTEYLISVPSSKLAQDFLKQIRTPSEAYFPTEFFTVDLKFGQSISTLAKQYLGSAWQFYALAKYNNIDNPSRIITGSEIKIPLTDYAKLAREKALLAQSAETPSEAAEEKVAEQPVEELTGELVLNDDESFVVAEIEEATDTPETLTTKIIESNDTGDFEQSLSLLEILKTFGELDAKTQPLMLEAMLGKAHGIKETDAIASSELFSQVAQLKAEEGEQLEAFEFYKLAYATDSANTGAKQSMDKLQQQIVEQYHREASIAFRQQKLEEAIAKWDLVLQVDPQHANASAYRTQAIELQQRLNAIKN